MTTWDVFGSSKAIYGLQASPLWWFKRTSDDLGFHGFKPLATELCIFIKGDNLILLYNDDYIMAAPTKQGIDGVVVILR